MEATDDESNPAAYEQWRWGRASVGEGGGSGTGERPADRRCAAVNSPSTVDRRRRQRIALAHRTVGCCPSRGSRVAPHRLGASPGRDAARSSRRSHPGMVHVSNTQVENPKPALARGSAPRRRDAGRYFFIASTVSEPSNARSLAGSSLPVRLFAAPPLLAGLLVRAVLACGLRHTNPLSLNVVTLPSASAWELEMPAESRDGETKIPWLAGLLALTAMRPCRCHIAGESNTVYLLQP
uniref:Uncharacterized protein n=1 Tax=Oryza glumipatula TaxID=40148 RepID=A0A0E0BIW7_9ORYZ